MSDLKRSAALLLILAQFTACSNTIPEYSRLMEVQSREELRNKFGEPVFIRSGRNFTDVAAVGEPPVNVQFPEIEIWEYVSARNGELGRAYFWFGVNNQTGEEILGDSNWVSADDT